MRCSLLNVGERNTFQRSGKQACKPGSVEGSHLSRRKVTFSLKRPYPGALRTTSSPLYLALLRTGFAWPTGHPAAGSLLHYLFTLTLCAGPCLEYQRLGMPPVAQEPAPKAVCFCGTFPKITLAGSYPAPCPVEPGLSSGGLSRLRLPSLLTQIQYNKAGGRRQSAHNARHPEIPAT